MHIQDIMSGDPATCGPDTSVIEAARLMADRDVGAIPVVDGDGGEPVGIVTDRDVALRVVAEGVDPHTARVRDIMSDRIITIRPDADVDEASRQMAEHQVRRLVVVGPEGQVRGMLAQADLALHDRPDDVGAVVREISKPH